MGRIDPQVKTVIALLRDGALLSASFVVSETPFSQDEYSDRQWGKFNLWRLRAMLKRLHRQKIVKITENEDRAVISLTLKGRSYLLKHELEQMIIKKPHKWDGHWRLIIYDVGILKKVSQDAFREALKRLHFFRLQNSVYLYPYPCDKEIKYLREYYGIGSEVKVLTVLSIENEKVYKKYFNL